MQTLFEKIIEGELPAEIVYEDEQVVAIKDKFPKAPIHLLIITRKVIPSVQEMQEKDLPLLGAVFQGAQKLAREFGLEERGYRLVVNNGSEAGQTISHLHFHLLGGHPLGPMG